MPVRKRDSKRGYAHNGSKAWATCRGKGGDLVQISMIAADQQLLSAASGKIAPMPDDPEQAERPPNKNMNKRQLSEGGQGALKVRLLVVAAANQRS